MEANMQLINYYIENSSIHVNNIKVPNEVQLQYSIEVNISNIIRDKEISKAQVKLSHSVIAEKENENFCNFQVTIVGEFQVTDMEDDKKCEEVLKYNAIPVLSQVLRAYMISMSSLAGIKNINFPIINYVEFFKNSTLQDQPKG